MKPKKQTFDILAGRDGVDVIVTVEGYALPHPVCGAEWFVTKLAGVKRYRLSEVKSGMKVRDIDARNIGEALAKAEEVLTTLFRHLGGEKFNDALMRGTERMAKAKENHK
jgi:hypothetical protein